MSLSLLDATQGEWLRLPTATMREVGPAAQTLAGLLAITNRETFSAAAQIAERARLPLKTVRKHLATLDSKGWIKNAGRGHTRAGPRRTCTIRITKKSTESLSEFGVLPWWACEFSHRIPNDKVLRKRPKPYGRLSWSAKAVLSIVLARLMSIRAVVLDCCEPTSLHDFWEAIDDFCGNERFAFSLDSLGHATGLSRPAIIGAKRELQTRGLIELVGNKDEAGGSKRDYLEPSRHFFVMVENLEGGKCRLTY